MGPNECFFKVVNLSSILLYDILLYQLLFCLFCVCFQTCHLEGDTAAWFGSLLQSDDFRLFCGMVDGLAFLPVDDLQNEMHLLRTLPSWPTRSCWATGILLTPPTLVVATAVPLYQDKVFVWWCAALRRCFHQPSGTYMNQRKWWPQNKQRLRWMEQQVLQLGRLCPPIHLESYRMVPERGSDSAHTDSTRLRRQPTRAASTETNRFFHTLI